MKMQINTEEIEKIVSYYYKNFLEEESDAKVSFKFEGYKAGKPMVKIFLDRTANFNGIKVQISKEEISKVKLDQCLKFFLSKNCYVISNSTFMTEKVDYNGWPDTIITGIECDAKRIKKSYVDE